MSFGGRSAGRILRAPLQRDHWRTAAQMLVRYPRPLDAARRYVAGAGDYPHTCRVRTPIGIVSSTLYSSHDMATVNEVFCRQDYRAGEDLVVAVDLGANIGISSLYFLTRNESSRVYAWEPDPKNVERLRDNLEPFAGRYELHEAAVALEAGTATFGVEPIGRYGTLELDLPTGHPAEELIEVRTEAINDLLGEIIGRHGRIDLLKIDTEGSEEKLVAAIADEHLDRIATIVYETEEPAPFHGDLFEHRFSSQTNRLAKRGRSGG